MSHERPDLDKELRGLKDFQRRTVDHVVSRLWNDADPVRRFLVADEVGLGKTLVARGVIAKGIDELWDKVDRIDVVYICSNAQIAQQNLARLRVGVSEDELPVAERLTMLAKEIHQLQGKKLNFISFTPGTSFDVSTGGGQAPERVLLYWLLSKIHGSEIRTERWLHFFRARAGADGFRRRLDAFRRDSELDDQFVADFRTALDGATGPKGRPLSEELFECVNEFKGRRQPWAPPPATSTWRYHLIGRLRRLLAKAAVAALEPDIVILDEFQRFKELLAVDDDTPNEARELAQELFNFKDAKLILLSATPYKMYTLPDEPEGDDHYADFIQTVRFLTDDAGRTQDVESALSRMRSALYAGDLPAATEAKETVERELRRVMVRTERLGSTPDRDGMIAEHAWTGVTLTPADVDDYRRLTHTSRALESFDPLEFWRSSPYVLELMENYKLKKALVNADPEDGALLNAMSAVGNTIDHAEINHYRALDPGNAKMRGLCDDVLERGAWRLAWIPPSLPYYELSGAYAEPQLREFTKRLIFSSWAVAPKAIATVVSYEAERRLMAAASADREYYARRRQTPLLAFQRSEGRLTGMPVLGLMYPSIMLARIGDPLALIAELGATMPVPLAELQRKLRAKVTAALSAVPRGASSGAADPRWYWAAPILMDRAHGHPVLLGDLPFGFDWSDDPAADTAFEDHVRVADDLNPRELGPRPDDLEDVLADLALAGPGVSALRALHSVTHEVPLDDPDLRAHASSVAWALRNLFNQPELIAFVRSAGEESAYWRDVLTHCLAGGLQPTLDEYVHVLNESLGVAERPVDVRIERIAREIDTALSTRTAVNRVDDFEVKDGRLTQESRRMRSHFALRFGRGTSEDDKTAAREGQVRASYNSPFWPFVLASTSVGQEGLDFHPYSHAIVHWNLPSNPVDLEQREGRVHRFKGHAVRKNIARVYGARPELLTSPDPWATMFDLAAADRPSGENELWPYWIYPLTDGAHIERHVPALPLSKESHAYRRLMRTVAAYRMVFGQPRQEDLLRYLADHVEYSDAFRIDLTP